MADTQTTVCRTFVCGLLGVLLTTTALRADHLVMRDGSTRDGTIVSQDEQTLKLRMENGGMRMTLSLSLTDIREIHRSPNPATQPSTSMPSTLPPANTGRPGSLSSLPPNSTLSTATAPATQPRLALSTRHFFREWVLLGLGKAAVPYDLETLPPEQGALWTKSLEDEEKKDRTAELVDLSTVANTPGVDFRLLNKLSMRYHATLFGPWLGQLRWEHMRQNYPYGQFDLGGVTPVETPTLTGRMRAVTLTAIDPLKRYYPLPPGALDVPKAVRPRDPLSDIPSDLPALKDIKDKAYFAAALVSAQLKLEPDMPHIDQIFLRQQNTALHAIIAKCNELEPPARIVADKAERDRKAAEAKEKQQADRQHSVIPPSFRQ